MIAFLAISSLFGAIAIGAITRTVYLIWKEGK